MSLGGNVRTLRISAHLTVDELYLLTHVPAAVIRSIENGAIEGSKGQVQALARHFGTTEEVLRAD